tara:strand:- start:173 stop:562 length:390 start_codon:yes stop_codon:yes gene_type:complete
MMDNNEKKLLYTKEHEWLRIEGNCAYIGITNHAQGELGDIIFVELPDENEVFEKMEVFGTLEAVKTVADLFTPVSCKILEINNALEDKSELINKDPYNQGWIIKAEILNNDELDELMSYEEYNKMINNG